MAFDALSSKEKDIVLRCMKATTAYVDDCEKHSRLGLEPQELQRVLDAWPNIDDTMEDTAEFLAVNNSLNEVCHGFRIAPDEWGKWFDAPKSEIEAVYRKWLGIRKISEGIR